MRGAAPRHSNRAGCASPVGASGAGDRKPEAVHDARQADGEALGDVRDAHRRDQAAHQGAGAVGGDVVEATRIPTSRYRPVVMA
ncbi:hypothetical protein GCM10010309_08760 [Streptomyces violaceochromogenes]|nr:hypothetical protein GCM10010309_08760 [Streptomyces violaceochromogenes]